MYSRYLISLSALGRVDTASASAHSELEQLLVAANSFSVNGMALSVRQVAERVHQLKSICNVTLVNDAIRVLHAAQTDQTTPLTELNAVSQSDWLQYLHIATTS